MNFSPPLQENNKKKQQNNKNASYGTEHYCFHSHRDNNIDAEDEKHHISKNLSSRLEIHRKMYRNLNKSEMKIIVKIFPVVVRIKNLCC